MNWLASVPVLVAYALGLLVIAVILAWVAYVMAEIARAARPEAWATAREGLAFGQDLARRLPRGRDWPRRLLARFPRDGVSRTGSAAGQLDPPPPGAPVLYVGPGDWTYITAWVIDAHPDGALDVEWVHPFLGEPVRASGVRPERDRAAGVAYWRSHPRHRLPTLMPSTPLGDRTADGTGRSVECGDRHRSLTVAPLSGVSSSSSGHPA